MTSGDASAPPVVWATRGRHWGFRILLDAAVDDPLAIYERAFAGLGNTIEALQRSLGETALRFPDPEGRRDSAGRPIPHEFVLFDDLAEQVSSVRAGRQLLWPLVAPAFARVWDRATPPSAEDLTF